MIELGSQFLFLLSAVGAFNGLLLAAYIFINNSSNLSFYFLAALLVMISVRVGKSVLFYFSPELDKSILQIGLTACFFIGPFTYFYTYVSVNDINSFTKIHSIQIVFLSVTSLLIGFIYPYNSYPVLWGEHIYKIVNYTWLAYMVVAWIQIYKRFGAKQDLFHSKNILLLGVNIGVVLIWLAYFTASYTSYISGALSFSLILYITIVVFITYKKSNKVESYKSKKFDTETVNNLNQILRQTMLHKDYYCDPLLTMPKLAQKMGVTGAQVSQLLNDNLDKSFATYVNEMRIDKAKKLLCSDSNLTIEAVAEECGYNSMSTFYAAFKKIVGTTPAKYKKDFS